MPSYITREDCNLENEIAFLLCLYSRQKRSFSGSINFGKAEGMQRNAIHHALNESVSIVTGLPGTGKTTTMKQVVLNFQSIKGKGLLLCPYGRSVSRAKEAILEGGEVDKNLIQFKTVHSGIGYNNGNAKYGPDNKLPFDYVIIDELGTIGEKIFHSILFAVDIEKTRIILSGDPNQLGSISKGKVLKDLIDSDVIKLTKLTEVHRQAKNSGIIFNSIKILNGEKPVNVNPLTGENFSDCEFIEVSNSRAAAMAIKRKVSVDIPIRKRVDPLKDIQIIIPGKKGDCGTDKLNDSLKYILNKNESKQTFCDFKVGDKVINKKNRFDINLVNGDIGYVSEVNKKNLKVKFDEGMGKLGDGIVEYNYDNIGDLKNSIALTVHSTIGCEFDYVVTSVLSDHYTIINRNNLFTAITRAKKFISVYYNSKGLNRAIRNVEISNRRTLLRELMEHYDSKLERILMGKESLCD